MKKIILISLFGLMVSQTDVSSKLISYSLNISGGEGIVYIPITEIVGDNLERGKIEIVGFEGSLEDYLSIAFYSSQSQYGLNEPATTLYLNHYVNAMNSNSDYFFDPNVDYIGFDYQAQTNSVFDGNIYFIVTAEFPDIDTGYIEEGFDFCLVPGNNLVAFPCDNPVSVETALPELAQAEISQIIGAGVAATNFNGQFVGSLSNFTPGAGYWFKSSSSMCFNYACAE